MRNRLLLGVALLLAVGGLGAVLLWPRDDGPVSRARCERVRVGMTLAEVETVLGGPPGDYGTEDVYVALTNSDFPMLYTDLVRSRLWYGDDGLFVACFDEQGQVTMSRLIPVHRITVLDRLRAWLGF